MNSVCVEGLEWMDLENSSALETVSVEWMLS